MATQAREEFQIRDGDVDGGAETGRGYLRGERVVLYYPAIYLFFCTGARSLTVPT